METPPLTSTEKASTSASAESSHREFPATARKNPWVISVKTVGGGIELVSKCSGSSAGNSKNNSKNNSNSNSSGECQFTVQVFPEDRLESLQDQIEASTGLKASQQRLIYRGRLIGSTTPSGGGNGTAAGAAAAPLPPASAADKNQERDDAMSNNNINSNSNINNPKMKDIAGLADGQTIHLVKRRRETPDPESTDQTSNLLLPSTSSTSSSTPLDGNLFHNSSTAAASSSSSSSGTGGGGLLAALLGLSTLTEDAPSSPTNDRENTTTAAATRLRGARAASRSSSSSRRRVNHRLTAEDRQVPDPGSLEPVRQGLLTLHTLLPHLQSTTTSQDNNTTADTTTDATSSDEQVATPHASSSPLEANREWYRGQWLDVLDTVNQWLEATVVEIVRPHEILPPTIETTTSSTSTSSSTSGHRAVPPPRVLRDPAISASDLEGRRRLLLEPCGDSATATATAATMVEDEGNLLGAGGELAGFRPRSNNAGVQLLLIHYNGWPHRWDEWIRSDSDRLRPFRTRTRHPAMSTTTSPSPQSVFHESPRTNIVPHGADDAEDRMALLPELARAMAAINLILQQQVATATGTALADVPPPSATTAVASDLPWGSPLPQTDSSPATISTNVPLVPPAEGEETSNIISPYYDDSSDVVEGSDDEDMNAMMESLFRNCTQQYPSTSSSPTAIHSTPQYNARELHNLATLLDRLGRTLTDAAPHVASLADNLPPNHHPQHQTQQDDDEEEVEDLEYSDELFGEEVENALEEIADGLHGPESSTETGMGGLLSFLSRERGRTSRVVGSNSSSRRTTANRRSFRRGTAASASSTASTAVSSNQTTATASMIDPDHEDYVGGLVNTTRGEVRVGPRNRSSNEDMATLLGAYLTAATLGSAANLGEGSGGGEDQASGGLGLGLGLGQLLRGGTGIGGSGGGIDIHIHAVVTAPGMLPGGVGITTLGGGGGGGGGTTMGTTGLGGTRNLFSSTRRTGIPGSILRSSRPSTTSMLSSRRRTTNNASTEEDEDSGLFAELYSETPEPIDPNGSTVAGEPSSRQASSPSRIHYNRDDDTSDYVTSLRSATATSSYGSGVTGSSFRREMDNTPGDILARINHRPQVSGAASLGNLDPSSNVGAATIAGRSSTRRRSSRRSVRQEFSSADNNPGRGGDNTSTSSTTRHSSSSASLRQSSGWGRLFRRRTSAQDP